MSSDDRDDPNPYTPPPPGTPPPPRLSEPVRGALAGAGEALRGRGSLVPAEVIEAFLRDYERRMGITTRPKLSSETRPPAPPPRKRGTR